MFKCVEKDEDMSNERWIYVIGIVALVVIAIIIAIPKTNTFLDSTPLVTPPGPGEPTVPPAALQMQAAPSATPSPIQPDVTPSPTPSATSTLPAASGSDDVPMVEVPAGEFIMGVSRQDVDAWFYESAGQLKNLWVYDQVPQMRVYLDTFAIDQVEVTQGRYHQCIEAGVCLAPDLIGLRYIGAEEYLTDPQHDEYPAIVAWQQAQTYCYWAGKRLPTEAEWEKAARGTDGRLHPWGNEWDENRTEVYTALPDLIPVGQHPDGASPYNALDMGGNAEEWVDAFLSAYPGNKVELPFESRADSKVIRGSANRVGTAVSRRPYGDVAGFRCMSGREPTSLEENIVEIMTWPTPEPTLEPDLSQAAYIPAGEFIMGSDEAYLSGHPERIIYLDAYYIDKHEVSVADFVEFLNILGEYRYACDDHYCLEPTLDGKSFRGRQLTYENGRFEAVSDRMDHPISIQTWYGSQAYCRWKGGRLPTSAEWEKAARGTDGRKYPWGNEWQPDRAAAEPDPKINDPASTFPQPVGSHPGDVSPYGVFDMLGNTPEWVGDWFDRDYLSEVPYSNPTGPWRDEFDGFKTMRRSESSKGQKYGLPDNRVSGLGIGIGFRCTYSSLR